MLASISWLKKYVDVSVDTKTLAHDLTMAGLKVVVFEADGLVDLTRYGLNPPRITATLHLDDDSTQVLLVGGEDQSTGRATCSLQRRVHVCDAGRGRCGPRCSGGIG